MAIIDRYSDRTEGTGGFVDYFSNRPTISKSPVEDKPIEEKPIIENPIDPRYVLKQQQNQDSGPTFEEETSMRLDLDGVEVSLADFEKMKFNNLDDYLATTNIKTDKSGMFSNSFNFGNTSTLTEKMGKAVTTGEVIFGHIPIVGPIVRQFDTRTLLSPLGQDRYIQTSGIGNSVGYSNLYDEYEALAEIRDSLEANINLAKGAKPKPMGFAFTLNYKGSNLTAYRRPNANLYKGLPDGFSQQAARTIEAMQRGKDPRTYDPTVASEKNDNAISIMDRDGNLQGSYTLDGKFIGPSGQISQYGSMKNFETFAETFSKQAGVSTEVGKGYARQWLEESRSLKGKLSSKDRDDNYASWLSKAKQHSPTKTITTNYNKVYDYPKAGNMSARLKKEEQFKKTSASFTTPEDNRAAATRNPDAERITYEDDSSDDFDTGGVGQGGDEYGGLEFAQGGQVEMAEGDQVAPQMQEGTRVEPIVEGEDDGDMILTANELLEGEPESGFIRKPASETTDEEGVTDDNPTLAPNENNPRGAAIIINKQAVDQMGEQDAVKMIKEARAYLRSKGGEEANLDENNPEGMTEIITADGEMIIQPEEADVIGRKKLLALNERGKRATRQIKKKVKPKQEGFITANEGLEVSSIDPDRFSKVWNEYKGKITGGTQAENNNKSRDKAQRLLKQFTDQELLAFVMLSEGSTLGNEGAEGIAHIILNRINSEEADFAKINTVYEAITKRQKGKSGNRVFQFQGLEPTSLKKYLRLLNAKDPATTKKYNEYVNIADEVIAGAREDFTNNSTFFWDPRSSTDKFMIDSVKSGNLIPQGRTKVGNFLHEYLKMAGRNRQSTMPNEEEIIRKGQYDALTENYMNRMNRNQPRPNLDAQSQGGGFISRYNLNRAKPLVSLN